MHDELPEVFGQLPPHAAPAALRERTLATVERELKRSRKPRWERALELSVATAFLVGIGLNADMLFDGARVIASLPTWQTEYEQRGPQLARQPQPRVEVELVYPRAGSFDEDYAKLLARLSEPPAG